MACQINVLMACAAHFYVNNQHQLGLFFICMMTDKDMYTKGEQVIIFSPSNLLMNNVAKLSAETLTSCDLFTFFFMFSARIRQECVGKR